MQSNFKIIEEDCNPPAGASINLELIPDLKIALSCSEESLSVQYTIYAIDEFECSNIEHIKENRRLSNQIVLIEDRVQLTGGKNVLKISPTELTKKVEKRIVLENLIGPKISELTIKRQTSLGLYRTFGLEYDLMGLFSRNTKRFEIHFQEIDSEVEKSVVVEYKSGNDYNYGEINQYLKSTKEATGGENLKTTNWLRRLDNSEIWNLISHISTLWFLGTVGRSGLEVIEENYIEDQQTYEEYQIESHRGDVIKDKPRIQYLSNAVFIAGTLINKSTTHAYEIHHIMAAYEKSDGDLIEYDRVEDFPIVEPDTEQPYSLKIGTGNEKASRIIEDVIVDMMIFDEIER